MQKNKRHRKMLIPSGMPVLMYIITNKIELCWLGTMTYFNLDDTFGAFGHNFADLSDSILKSGFMFAADNVKISLKSTPGTLGCLEGDIGAPIGPITAGSEAGFFGGCISEMAQPDCEPVPIGFWFEVVPGTAQIICSVTGKPEYYDIEVLKSESFTEFVVKMTDTKLLTLTGGFLEGMSGSPIIQNRKLIGALRMTIYQDPRIGTAIYISEMFMSHLGSINSRLRETRSRKGNKTK